MGIEKGRQRMTNVNVPFLRFHILAGSYLKEFAMTEGFELAQSLPSYVAAMRSQRRRHYDDPWDDWPDRNTGIHRHPVLYALWSGTDESTPIYIGQTVNMGKRLSEHFAGDWWTHKPGYVTYLDLSDFEDPATLSVAEKFLIAIMKPTDNDPRR